MAPPCATKAPLGSVRSASKGAGQKFIMSPQSRVLKSPLRHTCAGACDAFLPHRLQGSARQHPCTVRLAHPSPRLAS